MVTCIQGRIHLNPTIQGQNSGKASWIRSRFPCRTWKLREIFMEVWRGNHRTWTGPVTQRWYRNVIQKIPGLMNQRTPYPPFTGNIDIHQSLEKKLTCTVWPGRLCSGHQLPWNIHIPCKPNIIIEVSFQSQGIPTQQSWLKVYWTCSNPFRKPKPSLVVGGSSGRPPTAKLNHGSCGHGCCLPGCPHPGARCQAVDLGKANRPIFVETWKPWGYT